MGSNLQYWRRYTEFVCGLCHKEGALAPGREAEATLWFDTRWKEERALGGEEAAELWAQRAHADWYSYCAAEKTLSKC